MLPQELIDKINTLSSNYFSETLANRHHMHSHPELSFKEYNTADYVKKELAKIGYTLVETMANTGVIALLKDANTKGKVVGLRSDLDALPIHEMNEVPYKSKYEGIMHACGHDVHTAILLTTAKILFELKNEIVGNVKLIFQPGEEVLPGGASLLIKEGVLHNPEVDFLIAQHVTPQIPVGKVGFKSGLFMASTDELYLTVKGKGGHAAMPHTYINPLLVASKIMLALNQYFMVDKKENTAAIPTVIAFGKIEGKGATNVIPDEVEMAGTFRTLNEPWRQKSHQAIKAIAEQVAAENNAACDVNIVKGYPCLVNDEALTKQCFAVTDLVLGSQSAIDIDYRMTAEDFAYFSQQKPVCFYRLGTGNASKNTEINVHNSSFNIDEDVLEFAPALMAAMAIEVLNLNK